MCPRPLTPVLVCVIQMPTGFASDLEGLVKLGVGHWTKSIQFWPIAASAMDWALATTMDMTGLFLRLVIRQFFGRPRRAKVQAFYQLLGQANVFDAYLIWRERYKSMVFFSTFPNVYTIGSMNTVLDSTSWKIMSATHLVWKMLRS